MSRKYAFPSNFDLSSFTTLKYRFKMLLKIARLQKASDPGKTLAPTPDGGLSLPLLKAERRLVDGYGRQF